MPRDDTRDAIEHSDAVLLFVERTRRVVHDFVLTPANRSTVARICWRLGGIPLAIELAAAWSHALTPEEIAAEVARGLELLALSDRDGDLRHHSMRATLDHSWVLLVPGERRALVRLSVFRGGFDRAAAVEVTGTSLPLLGALLDTSLLQREQRAGITRYMLHELVRQYAAERFAEDAADQAETEARHTAYYASLLQRAISVHTGGSSPEAWTRVIGDIDNVRAAWDRAVSSGGAESLLGMTRGMLILYDHLGWARDGATLFEQAAQALRLWGPPAAAARGLILGTQGYFLQRSGRPASGDRGRLKEGLALMQAAGAAAEVVNLLLFLGSAEFVCRASSRSACVLPAGGTARRRNRR